MAIDFIPWHDITAGQLATNWFNYSFQGYRFVSLSVYGTVNAPLYAAVVIRRPVVVPQYPEFAMTMPELLSVNDTQYGRGFGLRILTATGSANNPLFAAVWEPMSPILDPYFNLDQPSFADLIQSSRLLDSDHVKESTTIPISIDVYGDPSDRRYTVVLVPNQASVCWDATSWDDNNVEDSAAAYQTRFDVQTSDGMRVFQISPSGDGYYASAFRDDQIGEWWSYHGMTSAGYQSRLSQLTNDGYFPISVQAGGSGSSTRFAAIFTRTEEITPRSFTITGLPASSPFDPYDTAMEVLMETYNIRQAALALVKDTRLVLARGYTYAEPGYPIVQPTTTFWIASCSKVFTSLLIHQLVHAGSLSLNDTMESILNLQTPAGGAPVDARFELITVENLLDHLSGVVPGASPGQVLASFPGAQLPIIESQFASWLAAQGLVDSNEQPLVGLPGDYVTWQYNNVGYDLLGQIVESKRRMSYIDAVSQYISVPLGLAHTRLAVGSLDDQPPDQAHHVFVTLPLVPSQLFPDQRLAPFGYDNNFVISAGAGGLASAVVDMARVLAALNLKSAGNPLLDPGEINAMFQAAARTMADSNGKQQGLRAHGWDQCYAEQVSGGFQKPGSPSGAWYAQKGGQYAGAGATMRHSTTGISMALAVAHQPVGVREMSYPDFPAVIKPAESQDWGTTDLFPDFGMPSLT